MFKIRHIMVVDDDSLIGTMVSSHLDKQEQFKTYYYKDPREALKDMAELRPHLILLDWMMPEVSGLYFTLQVRGNNEFKNTPIFMLTAKNTQTDLDVARQAGINGYFVKPIDFDALVDRLTAFFESQGDEEAPYTEIPHYKEKEL